MNKMVMVITFATLDDIEEDDTAPLINGCLREIAKSFTRYSGVRSEGSTAFVRMLAQWKIVTPRKVATIESQLRAMKL